MEDTLTSFKTAKLAKQKGFNIPVHNYFSKSKFDKEYSENIGFNHEYWGDNYIHDWNTLGEPFKPFSKDCFSQPTLSLLQKWLREVKGIDIVPPLYFSDYGYACVIIKKPRQKFYETYDEALENELYVKLKELPDYINE